MVTAIAPIQHTWNPGLGVRQAELSYSTHGSADRTWKRLQHMPAYANTRTGEGLMKVIGDCSYQATAPTRACDGLGGVAHSNCQFT